MSRHVAVIGAGIIGAACAIELLRDGHQVTIIEPGEPGGEQAASYGNGTLLNPSSVIPMSSPGIWKKVPGYLRDPLGPLAIRWRYLPRLLPWLRRFVTAGSTPEKVATIAHALQPLLADAPERHHALAEEAGVGELITRQGVLFAYPDRAAFEAEAMSWRIRHDNGTRWLELDADQLRQSEPTLSRNYKFAVLVQENGQCRDPGAYVAALIRLATASGATLLRTRATGFHIALHRLRAVLTEAGEVEADNAVIAAGAYSKQLAAVAGDRVPLETERG
ncbi:MAG TPA: FAD-binding oxidoreductase, partial [Acetobacteraceae bacterium]|nr:FAD-binding oxidoreductase [Acetobacteraceae bacterium]